MANASRHKVGPGAQGKGSGTGAMSELPEGVLPDNMVLSNRDKSRHSDERGLDSKNVQTEQYQDHVGNRQTVADLPPDADANNSGLANPQTDESGAQSSLKKQQQA
ncbi:hypothetical protein MKK88_04825 [Methylobacterium sp. E-005]|uniref:hypothetical protein n=1 Tax=Methylobacterium sp. E-005 TaxID=2836549 RepID=UPI001FBB7111|nr:hypothetical protein [Methylobacterium sp. E-005]MCJ2085318.1 hypothetical protein [Methylobacterium sp. E-005]